MELRDGRGADHLLCIDLSETGDVLGDGPVEEFDVLRHIADAPAEIDLVVVAARTAVDEDLAVDGGPDADEDPRQCRLARARWTEDRGDLTGDELQIERLHDESLALRRPGGDALQLHLLDRRGEQPGRCGLGCNGMDTQQGFDAREGFAGSPQRAPLSDDELDRLQRLAEQDAADEHAADGELVVDDEQRAGAETQ